MATKKIQKWEPSLRDWWNEDEARAALNIASRTKDNDDYWSIISREAGLYPGGYFKDRLYKAMLNHPLVNAR